MTDKKLQEGFAATDAAISKINEMIKEGNRQDVAVRVSAIAQGDQGHFNTEFQFVDLAEKMEDDVEIKTGEFSFFIDEASNEFLAEVTVDFVASGFTIYRAVEPSKLWDDEVSTEVQKIIDERLNPGIAGHGGFVTLLEVIGDTAYIEMGGGCKGCMMSYMTLKQGIETSIVGAVPEITKVVDRTDHEDSENPYYQKEEGAASPF